MLPVEPPPPPKDYRRPLHNQWGLSLYIQSQRGNEQRTIMLDFGYTPEALINNIELTGSDPRVASVRAVGVSARARAFPLLVGLFAAGAVASGAATNQDTNELAATAPGTLVKTISGSGPSYTVTITANQKGTTYRKRQKASVKVTAADSGGLSVDPSNPSVPISTSRTGKFIAFRFSTPGET